jgi:hypothetical protein
VREDAGANGGRAFVTHDLVRAHECDRREKIAESDRGHAEQRAIERPAGAGRHHRAAQRHPRQSQRFGNDRTRVTEYGRDRVDAGERRRGAGDGQECTARSGAGGEHRA